jgi:hypothetical protein
VADLNVCIGMVHKSSGDTEKALEQFEKALHIFKKDRSKHMNKLGDILSCMGII